MEYSYDPLCRGPHPVGVRTVRLSDASRDRALPVEVWYPAATAYAGADMDETRQDCFSVANGLLDSRQTAVRDADPAPIRDAPLIVFSHGLAGHRRQSTFFTTHLASHGYVVLAPDHVGNTLPEVLARGRDAPDTLLPSLLQSAVDRPQDMAFLIEHFPSSDDAAARLVDPTRIGLTGHSFGGWTTIVATSQASPVICALPLAPIGAGQAGGLAGQDPYASVDLGHEDRPPTLILAAARDSLCPLQEIETLRTAMGPQHGLLVLGDADHFHFCDSVMRVHQWFAAILPEGGVTGLGRRGLSPLEELVEERPAHAFVCGPGLAHFDAHLRDNGAAMHFLRARCSSALTAQGAAVTGAFAAARGDG